MKKNNFKKLLSNCLLLLICMASNAIFAQKTTYYRHLVFRETPFSDIKGIHPIDKKTSEKETHYRFVYDAQNRLVEVSHRLGNFIINQNHNWDSFIWFSPKMTITYAENQEIRHFYNRLDEQAETHGKMYTAVFDVNAAGKRTSMKIYDKDGKPSENAWGIHQYQWTHKGNGNVIEKRFNLKNDPKTIRPDFTFFTVRLEFGNDDLLDFIYHLDADGNIINNSMKAGMDRIVYDQEGNFSRWMVFDKDLKPVEGNAPEFAIGEHLYDARGNKVELRGFDVIGRLKAMPTGVAKVVNSYDTYNNQTEVKILDLEGNILQYIKREYSKDGRRIKWWKFLDKNGNLTTIPEGKYAAIKFEYDADGKMAGRKRFDANLKEVSE
jgi:hypothetical protein